MSHLVKHPWDSYGSPPPPGLSYGEPAEWNCKLVNAQHDPPHTDPDECIDELEMEADEADERAEELRADADEKESAANECRRIASLIQKRPLLGRKPEEWIEVTA